MTDNKDKLYCKCCRQEFKDRTCLWRHKQTQKHKKNELRYPENTTTETPKVVFEKIDVFNDNRVTNNININIILPNGFNMSDCPLPVLEMFQTQIKTHIDNWLRGLNYEDRPLHIADDNVFVKEEDWYEGREAMNKLDMFGEKFSSDCLKFAMRNFEGDKLTATLENVTTKLDSVKILHKNKKQLKIRPRKNPKV